MVNGVLFLSGRRRSRKGRWWGPSHNATNVLDATEPRTEKGYYCGQSQRTGTDVGTREEGTKKSRLCPRGNLAEGWARPREASTQGHANRTSKRAARLRSVLTRPLLGPSGSSPGLPS